MPTLSFLFKNKPQKTQVITQIPSPSASFKKKFFF